MIRYVSISNFLDFKFQKISKDNLYEDLSLIEYKLKERGGEIN